MKNSIGVIRPLGIAAAFACVMFAAGCGAKFNEKARQEGEAAGKEASALYEKSQKEVSLANKYSWQKWQLRGAKERDEQFALTAKELEMARDKFAAAAGKMKEALNGQKAFDNAEATSVSRMGDAYNKWSEMAEFERKTLQESVGVGDEKALTDKLTAAAKEQAKMNEDVMAMIRGASK